MDIHLEIYQYLQDLRPLCEWPAMDIVFHRRAAAHPAHWHIPVSLCLAAGGAAEEAIPTAAAVAALQTALLLVDDLLDGDERMAELHLGHGDVANLASAFQALSLEAILRSGFGPTTQQRLLASLNATAAETCLGQYWDAQNPQDEAGYWRVARGKSSPFFRAAFYAGAQAARADEPLAERIGELGFLYGEMIQIHDDLHDTLETPANPDWLQMRSPLPILFAQVVQHPLRERFLELRQAIDQPGALEEAQGILLRCGAISYCLDQLLQRQQTAEDTLAGIRLARPELVAEAFRKLSQPVRSLLELAGQ